MYIVTVAVNIVLVVLQPSAGSVSGRVMLVKAPAVVTVAVWRWISAHQQSRPHPAWLQERPVPRRYQSHLHLQLPDRRTDPRIPETTHWPVWQASHLAALPPTFMWVYQLDVCDCWCYQLSVSWTVLTADNCLCCVMLCFHHFVVCFLVLHGMWPPSVCSIKCALQSVHSRFSLCVWW